jgi:hypothetical protein
VTDGLIGRKRQINDVIRATKDRADAVVSPTAAALTHERNVRITVEASN